MEDLAYEMRWQSYRKDMNIRADNCARSGPHSYRALRRRFIEREKAEEELLGTWLQTTTAAEVRTTTAAEVQTTTAAAEVQTTTGAEVRTTTAAVAEEQTATAAEVRTATAAAEVQTTTGADTEVQTTPGAEAQLAQTTTAAAEAQLVQTATAAGNNDDNDDNDDNLEQCRIWSAARCGRHNLAMQYFGEEAHGAPTAEGTDGGGAMLDLLGVRAQMKKHFREETQSDTGNAGSGSASSASSAQPRAEATPSHFALAWERITGQSLPRRSKRKKYRHPIRPETVSHGSSVLERMQMSPLQFDEVLQTPQWQKVLNDPTYTVADLSRAFDMYVETGQCYSGTPSGTSESSDVPGVQTEAP